MRRGAGLGGLIAMTFLMAATARLGAEPQEQSSVPPQEAVAPAAESPSPDWQRELDLIADLLIDGKPLEARARAEELLEVAGLPEGVSTRAHALRDKAESQLAGTIAENTEPKPKIESPIPGEATEKKTDKTEAVKKPPKATSFRVRVAVVGSGFNAGTIGFLSISPAGLSFTRQGQSRESWTIPWQNLAEAKGADGMWDAPYPLVLVERGGRKHYVARIDAQGRYITGAPILSAIAEERRKAKETKPQPAAKPAEPAASDEDP